jgi:hypothetical protein
MNFLKKFWNSLDFTGSSVYNLFRKSREAARVREKAVVFFNEAVRNRCCNSLDCIECH